MEYFLYRMREVIFFTDKGQGNGLYLYMLSSAVLAVRRVRFEDPAVDLG